MPGKAQPKLFRFFEVPEIVVGNFKAKCKHCPAQISASTKATSFKQLYVTVKHPPSFCQPA